MNPIEAANQPRVVIAGGGIAAVETLLALRSLAPRPQLEIVVVAPNEDLHYRPFTVNEPFSERPARRYRLQGICDDLDAVLHNDTVAIAGVLAYRVAALWLPALLGIVAYLQLVRSASADATSPARSWRGARETLRRRVRAARARRSTQPRRGGGHTRRRP